MPPEVEWTHGVNRWSQILAFVLPAPNPGTLFWQQNLWHLTTKVRKCPNRSLFPAFSFATRVRERVRESLKMPNQKEKKGNLFTLSFYVSYRFNCLHYVILSSGLMLSNAHVLASYKKKYWLHEDEMIFIASCLDQDLHWTMGCRAFYTRLRVYSIHGMPIGSFQMDCYRAAVDSQCSIIMTRAASPS